MNKVHSEAVGVWGKTQAHEGALVNEQTNNPTMEY